LLGFDLVSIGGWPPCDAYLLSFLGSGFIITQAVVFGKVFSQSFFFDFSTEMGYAFS
jgi:hypothetical protein